MSLLEDLQNRSGNQCELCTSTNNLLIYKVKPTTTGKGSIDGSLLACKTCKTQIDNPKDPDANHWRCLNKSMWSEFRAVKVVAWRLLSRLKDKDWAKDLLDIIYLDEEELRFAKESEDHLDQSEKIIHKDANGAILQSGDTVV